MTPLTLTDEQIAALPDEARADIEWLGDAADDDDQYHAQLGCAGIRLLASWADARIEARRLAAENEKLQLEIHMADSDRINIRREVVECQWRREANAKRADSWKENYESASAERDALLRFAGEILPCAYGNHAENVAIKCGLMTGHPEHYETQAKYLTPLGQRALDAAKRAEGSAE